MRIKAFKNAIRLNIFDFLLLNPSGKFAQEKPLARISFLFTQAMTGNTPIVAVSIHTILCLVHALRFLDRDFLDILVKFRV